MIILHVICPNTAGCHPTGLGVESTNEIHRHNVMISASLNGFGVTFTAGRGDKYSSASIDLSSWPVLWLRRRTFELALRRMATG